MDEEQQNPNPIEQPHGPAEQPATTKIEVEGEFYDEPVDDSSRLATVDNMSSQYTAKDVSIKGWEPMFAKPRTASIKGRDPQRTSLDEVKEIEEATEKRSRQSRLYHAFDHTFFEDLTKATQEFYISCQNDHNCARTRRYHEKDVPHPFYTMAIEEIIDPELFAMRCLGPTMSNYTVEDVLKGANFDFPGARHPHDPTTKDPVLHEIISTKAPEESEDKEEQAAEMMSTSKFAVQDEIEHDDVGIDPFPSVDVLGTAKRLTELIGNAECESARVMLSKAAQRGTLHREFRQAEEMTDRFERVYAKLSPDKTYEDVQRLWGIKGRSGNQMNSNQTTVNHGDYQGDPFSTSRKSEHASRTGKQTSLFKNRVVYDKQQAFKIACNREAPNLKRSKDARLKVERRIKRLQGREDQVLQMASDSLRKADQVIIKQLTVLLKSKKSRAEMRDELSQYYYLPKNVTKLAMQRIIKTALSDSEKNDFGAIRIGVALDLAENFGFDNMEAFEDAIKSGLGITRLREIRQAFGKEMKDAEEGDDAISSEGDFDCDVSNHVWYVKEKVAQSKLIEGEKVKGDLEGLETMSIGSGSSSHYKENEVKKANEILRERAKVITAKDGISCYPLKFGYTYCYKLYAMYRQLVDKVKTPFGRTLPNLAYVYILGLLVDPENNLGTRYEEADYLIHLGGISIIEKHLLIPDKPNIRLEELFQGLAKDRPTDGGMMGMYGAAVKRIKKLNRLAARLSGLNDKSSDLKERILLKSEEIAFYRSNLSEVDRMCFSESVATNNLAINALEGGSLKKCKNDVYAALGLGAPVDVADIADIRFPYTLNCMNFMRRVNGLFQRLDEEKDKLMVEYQFVCLIEDSIQTDAGMMNYLLRILSLPGHERTLKHWFKSKPKIQNMKTYFATLQRQIEAGDLSSHHAKYKTVMVNLSWQSFVYRNGNLVFTPENGKRLKTALEILGKREDVTDEFVFSRPTKKLKEVMNIDSGDYSDGEEHLKEESSYESSEEELQANTVPTNMRLVKKRASVAQGSQASPKKGKPRSRRYHCAGIVRQRVVIE